MNIRNIVNIARVLDISALNRCLSYEKCDSCVFFNDDCTIASWGGNSDKYNEQLMKILNDFCFTREACDECILNTNKGCSATELAYQVSQRKRGIQ